MCSSHANIANNIFDHFFIIPTTNSIYPVNRIIWIKGIFVVLWKFYSSWWMEFLSIANKWIFIFLQLTEFVLSVSSQFRQLLLKRQLQLIVKKHLKPGSLLCVFWWRGPFLDQRCFYRNKLPIIIFSPSQQAVNKCIF